MGIDFFKDKGVSDVTAAMTDCRWRAGGDGGRREIKSLAAGGRRQADR